MPDGLIEDQFDGHPRIGAGEHGGERFLLFGVVLPEDFEVVVVGGNFPSCEAFVSVDQFLHYSVGSRQVSLRECFW
jgi:hypothetical protein